MTISSDNQTDNKAESTEAQEFDLGLSIGRLIKPALIVIAALVVAAILIFSKPKAKRVKLEKTARAVETMELVPVDHQVMVDVMGTVVAARSIGLQPRVSGEIIEVSPRFIPGGCFRAGEVILKIDPKDYEYTVRQRKADVVSAEYAYKLELGQQDIAGREWKLLKNKGSSNPLDRELALRKPHLNNAKAALDSAKAALEKAELDLKRTVIRAPFNGVVFSKGADLGAQVSTSTTLGTFVGSDEYWVKVSIPVDRLKWIDIPHGQKKSTGSPATITAVSGAEELGSWKGSVIRRMAELESEGRMAQVLVSVPDPLGSKGGKPLLLGSYVAVSIAGKSLENVFVIPRDAVRDNDRLWFMAGDNTLEVRDADIIWNERDYSIVRDGFKAGDVLVTGVVASAVQGMPLKEVGGEDNADADAEKKASVQTTENGGGDK